MTNKEGPWTDPEQDTEALGALEIGWEFGT